MSNKPTEKPKAEIEVQQSQIPTFYVNFTGVAQSNYEITFTMGRIKEASDEKVKIDGATSIIMSVEYFKTFAKLIKKIEKNLENSQKGE